MTDKPDDTITVTLTLRESSALRLASCFGSPHPTPPEIVSARQKLGEAEQEFAKR